MDHKMGGHAVGGHKMGGHAVGGYKMDGHKVDGQADVKKHTIIIKRADMFHITIISTLK